MLRLQDSGSATSQAIGPKLVGWRRRCAWGCQFRRTLLLPDEPLDSAALRSAPRWLSAGSLPPANDSGLAWPRAPSVTIATAVCRAPPRCTRICQERARRVCF